MALIDDLASYWKLDESSGNAADAHGLNTLTNNGSTAYVAGKINNGADFEATSSQYLSITDAAQTGLDFSTAVSLSFWVNAETLAQDATYVVASKYTSAGTQRQYTFFMFGQSGNATAQ